MMESSLDFDRMYCNFPVGVKSQQKYYLVSNSLIVGHALYHILIKLQKIYCVVKKGLCRKVY